MNLSHVIKKAILSEKAYKLMECGVYTFLVDATATKDEIKKALERQFSTKIKKINVSKFAPKVKRIATTRKTTLVGGGKKAQVFLVPGENIPLIKPLKEDKKPKKQDLSKESTKKEVNK